MKALAMLVVAALALAGCTTTGGGDPLAKIDAAIQKAAPGTCAGATTIYTAFVASPFGSENDRALIDAAWKSISPICAHASQITSAELLIVAAQTATIVKVVREARKHHNVG